MKPDELDEKIIAILRKDSRTSNVEIASALGLTEGAVRRRIKMMSESGIIRRFTVETSSGTGSFAVLMLKARGETKKMMAEVTGLGIHRDAYEISGEFDGCVILEGPGMEEIDSKIDRIRKIREVSETRTFISFRRW